MRSKAGMKFECIFEESLDFIDIDYTHLNKTVRYEQRPHGEWEKVIVVEEPRKNKRAYAKCTECGIHFNHYNFAVRHFSFCPNCGASMSANDKQVTGKLNSEIEKSKSKIIPDYRDGWKLKEGGQ